MKKMFWISVCLLWTGGLSLAADVQLNATTPEALQEALPQVDDGGAPMAINPNTMKPYRSPFLHGTFDSVNATTLIIRGRTNHEEITFLLKKTIPVYDSGRQPISFNDLKVGDHLKVHFQKNSDLTMTALAVYRVAN